MNKAKLLICAVVGTLAMTACVVDDNPTPNPNYEPQDTTTVSVDGPRESVTDQPAYVPGT